MAIPSKVINYLQKQKIVFDVIEHRVVYTAFDLAQTLREKLDTIGKTLLIRTEQGFVLVVLGANKRLDIAKLKALLGVKKIRIATEKDMVKYLKIKPGAITPFGNLHKAFGVVVDSGLAKTSTVFLGAGSFTESLRMKMKDFLKLEKPQVGSFSVGAKLPKVTAKPKKKAKKKTAKKKSAKKPGKSSAPAGGQGSGSAGKSVRRTSTTK